jgi:hypothetical protein
MSGHISTRVLRFALPSLLIVLVLAGLRGAASAPGWAGRYHGDGIAVGLVLEVVLAALLVALLIRERRTGPATFVVGRLRTLLRYLLIAGLVAIPVVVLFNLHLHPLPPRTRPPLVKMRGKLPKLKLRMNLQPAPLHFPLADVLYGLLVVVLIAAVVLCCVLVARRGGEDGEPDLDPADPSELGAAVESGRSALLQLDDARAAIIACYVAMEESLAQAGAARAVADTPDELLARAVAAGLASVAAASRLTALFYEARFSTHPLGPGERDEAERALSEIAATVSGLGQGEGAPAVTGTAVTGAGGPAGGRP